MGNAQTNSRHATNAKPLPSVPAPMMTWLTPELIHPAASSLDYFMRRTEGHRASRVRVPQNPAHVHTCALSTWAFACAFTCTCTWHVRSGHVGGRIRFRELGTSEGPSVSARVACVRAPARACQGVWLRPSASAHLYAVHAQPHRPHPACVRLPVRAKECGCARQ